MEVAPCLIVVNDSSVLEKDTVEMTHSVLVPILLMITGMSGFLIASFILFRRKQHDRRRETAFYKLVTTLLCVDASGILGCYPLGIAVYINDKKWIGGQPTCNVFAFLSVFAIQESSILIAIMAVERFISIKHPMLHAYYINSARITVVILICILFSAIYSCLPFIDVGQYTVHDTGTWCTFLHNNSRPRDVRFAVMFTVIGIICMVVTNVCNLGALMVILWPRLCVRNNNNSNYHHHHGEQARIHKNKVSKAEMNMIVLLTGISVTLTAGWTPTLVRIFLNQLRSPDQKLNPTADLIATRITSLSQVLDPWIYIILRRDSLARLVHWIRHQSRRNGTNRNSNKSSKDRSVIVLYSSKHSKASLEDCERAKMCPSQCINDDRSLPISSHV